jgi:hypothetical protein
MVVFYYYLFFGLKNPTRILEISLQWSSQQKEMFVCLFVRTWVLFSHKNTLVLGHDVRLWIFILCKLPNFNLGFYKV